MREKLPYRKDGDSELNTLGLDDDLDSVEFLEEVERVFGISISDAEASQMCTVRDVYNIIIEKLNPTHFGKCHTQMVFYRLRSALSPFAPELKLAPSTSIDIISTHCPKELVRFVGDAIGMNVPPTKITLLGHAGYLLLFSCIAATLVLAFAQHGNLVLWFTVGLFFMISVYLIRIDPRKFMEDDVTLGGLAKSIATHNYGKLIQKGGRHTRSFAWETLTEIAATFSEVIEKNQVQENTILLKSNYLSHKSSRKT